MTHRHKATRFVDRGYVGPVSREQNPAAHGNIMRTEYCGCGAFRQLNINGAHVELGAWRCDEENS